MDIDIGYIAGRKISFDGISIEISGIDLERSN